MTDYYKNTRNCIDEYNRIQDKIRNHEEPTTNAEDEFLQNHCIYLAHAIIKDAGFGYRSREEMCKMADIVNDVLR